MNAIAPISAAAVVAQNPMMPTDMDSAFRLAKAMASGKLVPKHLQEQPGDCLMVIEQAMRWGMSPFAVAQCTSVISGKLMFEGKLVAAAINTAPGVLSTRFSYEFSGEGDNRKIIASATMKGETKPKSVEVVLKDVKTDNKMWKTQPDQQLVYSANRIWGRRYAPEVMLGVYSPEEFGSTPDTFTGTTIDAAAEYVRPEPQRQPAPARAQMPQQTPVEADEIPDFDAPPPGADDANAIIGEMEAAASMEELQQIRDRNADKISRMAANLQSLIMTAYKGVRHGFAAAESAGK